MECVLCEVALDIFMSSLQSDEECWVLAIRDGEAVLVIRGICFIQLTGQLPEGEFGLFDVVVVLQRRREGMAPG